MSTIASFGNSWLGFGNQVVGVPEVDPYNPLGLPPYTVRFRWIDTYGPPSTQRPGATLTQVDTDIWDLTYESTGWNYLFSDSLTQTPDIYISEVLGANSTGVTEMAGMFRHLELLTYVPLFDTSSVLYMSNMFEDCHALETIPLYDTSSCTMMREMFMSCLALTTIPLIDTSNVFTMESMFYNCAALTTVPLLDTGSCTTMYAMLSNCPALTRIPLLDTTNVTDMWSMCSNTPLVEGGALDLYQQASATGLVTNHWNCFSNCGHGTATGWAELQQIPASWGGYGQG